MPRKLTTPAHGHAPAAPDKKPGKNFTVNLPVELIDEVKRQHAREVADGKVATDALFQDWYAELLRDALRRRKPKR